MMSDAPTQNASTEAGQPTSVKALVAYVAEDELYGTTLINSLPGAATEGASYVWAVQTSVVTDVTSFWQQTVKDHLGNYDVVVVMVSPDLLPEAEATQLKWQALDAAANAHNALLVPVLTRYVSLPPQGKFKALQFFKPRGDSYGQHGSNIRHFAYQFLVEADGQGGVKRNYFRDTYHKVFLERIEKALTEQANATEQEADLPGGPPTQPTAPTANTSSKEPIASGEDLNLPTMSKAPITVDMRVPAGLEPEDFMGANAKYGDADNYFKRDSSYTEDRRLQIDRNLELDLRDERKKGNLVVLGSPLCGSSRAVYEAMRKLSGVRILFFVDLKPGQRLPALKLNKELVYFAYFEHLDAYFTELMAPTMNQLLDDLRKLGVRVVATCNKGAEYQYLRYKLNRDNSKSFQRNEVFAVEDEEVEPFLDKLDTDNVDYDYDGFDGSIGTLFISRQKAIEVYAQVTEGSGPANTLAKTLLKGLRTHYYTRNYEANSASLYANDKIRFYCTKALGLTPEAVNADWAAAIQLLNNSAGGPALVQEEDGYLRTTPVYLEELVEAPLNRSTDPDGVETRFKSFTSQARSEINALYTAEERRQNGFFSPAFQFNRRINNKRVSYWEGIKQFENEVRYGLEPDAATFNVIISKAGNLKEAQQFYQRMHNLGVTPDQFTFINLLHKTTNKGEADEVLTLLKAQGLAPGDGFNSVYETKQ